MGLRGGGWQNERIKNKIKPVAEKITKAEQKNRDKKGKIRWKSEFKIGKIGKREQEKDLLNLFQW